MTVPSGCFPSESLIHAFLDLRWKTVSTCQPTDQKRQAWHLPLPVERANSSYGAKGK